MASWAEVVAEITFQVNKAAAAKEIEQAVEAAKPVVAPTVDTAGTGAKIDEAVASAHPVVTPGVDTAGLTPKVDEAVAAAHPVVEAGVDEPRITSEVDAAVASAHPTVTPAVNEAAMTSEVDAAAASAHPMISPAVNETTTGRAVEEAVEKSPPAAVPINTAKTGEKVEEGLRSANTAKAGEEGASKYTGAFTGPVTALKGMVMGAVGAEAIMGGQQLFTTLIQKSGEASKATKVVTDAIKVTGGTAGVTAEQIDKMASAQARSTGVEKPAIQQADALLLRFTNIRNVAGENNDVFNRTGQAALDLTAAMNKGNVTAEGLANTSKLLGKALDEPDKAAGALRRSGVDLDKQQQDQIKTFLKNNDTLDAQKVVLDAINKSYGGTAAATASGTAKMKAALSELEEELGKQLLPVFTNLIKAITTLLDVIAPVAEWFNRGGAAAHIIEAAIVGLVGAITLYITTVKTVEAATKAWATVQALLDAELTLNPIGLVVIAVAALAVGIYELYQHSKLFRDVVHETWAFIRDVVITSAHLLVAALNPVKAAISAIEEAWRLLFKILQTAAKLEMNLLTIEIRVAMAVITGIFKVASTVITGIWKAEFAVMTAVVKTFVAATLAAIRILVDITRGVLKIGMQLITGQWGAAWNTLRGTVRAVTGDITTFLHQALGNWTQAFSQIGGAIRGAWSGLWSDLAGITRSGWNGIVSAGNAAKGAFENTWNAMRSVATTAGGAIAGTVRTMTKLFTDLPGTLASVASGIAGAWRAIEHGIHDPIAWAVNNPIEGMIKVFNTVGGSVHLPRIPDVHMAAAGMRVTEGTTPTADDVHVRVSRGETILSYAHSMLLAPVLAAVGVPGYRRGGVPLPDLAVGGLVSGVISGAGRALSDVEGAVANAARDAASLAGRIYGDVVGGIVHVADLAVDAGQMASDLAVSEFKSIDSGFSALGGLAYGGATGWVKDATKGVTKEIAGATAGHLKGFAGVAAKVLDSGGWLEPGQYGYNGTARPELVIPGYAAGGIPGLPSLHGLISGSGGAQGTGLDPSVAKALLDSNANLAGQLAQIGQILQANPRAIADAIAQALNGVARLATAGAAYATR
jgi:hypothetical protein